MKIYFNPLRERLREKEEKGCEIKGNKLVEGGYFGNKGKKTKLRKFRHVRALVDPPY